MKNFSENCQTLKTQKDRLCENFAEQSGLPIEIVQQLYENLSIQGEENISGKFSSLLSVTLKTFEQLLNKLFTIIKDSTKNEINGAILNFLNDNSDDSDSTAFIKIILYILFVKDNKNFQTVAAGLNFPVLSTGTSENLFESVGINPDFVKQGRVPSIAGVNDDCDIKSEIEFYGDLKTILSRNNRRWGENYHLNNAYEGIMLYLDKEIEYLVNKDNITSIDDEGEDRLIKQLMNGHLNVMYRDVNYLRTEVSDIQTLVFDMMCLVMSFVRKNGDYCRYISRDTFDDFLQAFRQLYSRIINSRTSSRVLIPYEKPNTEGLNDSEVECSGRVDRPFQLEILEGVYIDTNKYDVWTQPLKVESVVDCLYIMKSCSVEFNLMIRPFINNFITKSFEVIGKIEHIMIESNKINKYKN